MRKFRIPYIPYRSPLLSTTVLNDDPMQNPGQTRIFYKAGQTQMTQQKRDPYDPVSTLVMTYDIFLHDML